MCQGIFSEIPGTYAGVPVIDHGDRLILPGLVDMHIHAPQFAFRGKGRAAGAHGAIRRIAVRENRIELYIRPKAPEYLPLIEELADKIQQTLDYCREVAAKRSDLRITQEEVVILPEKGVKYGR